MYFPRSPLYRPLVIAFLLGAACIRLANANDGYALSAIGPAHRGIAGAGVSSPENSTWILVNPAGIAGMERQLDFYAEALLVERFVIPRGVFPLVNVFAGKDVDDANLAFASFSLTFPLQNDWTLGTGLIALGGTSVNFDTPRTFLSVPMNADRRSGYEVAQVPLILAKEFDNGWSVGFGVIGNVQRLRTDALTLNLRPAEGDHAWDYAYGGGFALGVQWRGEHWSLGGGYYSRQWVTDFKKYPDIIKYNLDVPQRLQVGAGYHPNERWDFLLDYKFIHYSSVRQLGTGALRSGISWQDHHSVKAGVRFRPTERWTLRAGVSQGQSPIVDEAVFMNAQFPALVETMASAGFSYGIRENVDLHFAYSWTKPETRRENGQGDLFSILGRGTEIGLKTHAFSAGLTYRF